MKNEGVDWLMMYADAVWVWFAGEKGRYSVNTVASGPAERAGVQKGDHLVWINGAIASELTQSAINKMVGRNIRTPEQFQVLSTLRNTPQFAEHLKLLL